jgi:hypothetical protein
MPRRLNAEGGTHVTWADAHALLDVEVTATDRLDLFAGDGEAGPEAPDSVRSDPELLLAWCLKYEPRSVLPDEAAMVQARNRTMSEVVARIRRSNPKLRVTPTHVIDYLRGAHV